MCQPIVLINVLTQEHGYSLFKVTHSTKRNDLVLGTNLDWLRLTPEKKNYNSV